MYPWQLEMLFRQTCDLSYFVLNNSRLSLQRSNGDYDVELDENTKVRFPLKIYLFIYQMA